MHYWRNVTMYGRGHEYGRAWKERRALAHLIQVAYPVGVARQLWEATYEGDADGESRSVTAGSLPELETLVKARSLSRPARTSLHVTTRQYVWTTYGALPPLPANLHVPEPDAAVLATFDSMIGTSRAIISTNHRSGYDVAVVSEPLDVPLADDVMDRFHGTLCIRAQEKLADVHFIIDRAYYDTHDRMLLLGGVLRDRPGKDAPLVFVFTCKGGGAEWVATFDLDDGFMQAPTPSMIVAFRDWKAKGGKARDWPFLPPLSV